MESWNSALCYVPLCQLSPEKEDTNGYTVLQKLDIQKCQMLGGGEWLKKANKLL